MGDLQLTHGVALPESSININNIMAKIGKPDQPPCQASRGEVGITPITLLAVVRFALQQLYRFGLIIAWIVWPGKLLSPVAYGKRFFLLTFAATCFVAIQLVHGIGWLIDEILFRDYRNIKIEKPVFILGAPRSGTTTAHRMLAGHAHFTTTSGVDCLLAPNICQRKFLRLLVNLDSAAGAPVARLINAMQTPVINRISSNHQFSLTAPEEDFLFFAPLLQCFLLVVPFPRSHWLWKLATADKNPGAVSTRLTFNWYRMCIQKHMYCNPHAARYLAKNPTFSGVAHQLRYTFPDCQFVICERDATSVVHSQFRVLAPLRKLLAGSEEDAEFDKNLIETLLFYYTNLDQVKSILPTDQVKVLPLSQVSAKPDTTFSALYRWLDQHTENLALAPKTTVPAVPEQIPQPTQQQSFTQAKPDNYRVSQVVEDAMVRFNPWRAKSEHVI